MRYFKSKCACCVGGIGICLCIIFMSIGIVGVTTVGLAKNSNMNSMSEMSSMATNREPSIQNMIITFFSGIWGEVILIISFAIMNVGIWFSKSWKIIPFSIAAGIILYVSMYLYYSVPLESLGLVILFFAYFATFNNKVAKIVKLV